MENKKISALASSTTPLAGTEVLPIVQSSTTVKVSVDNLTAGRVINALSGAFSVTSADAVGAYLNFQKTRTASVVQNNDVLGNVVFRGFDGTQQINAAQISSQVDGTPGTNDMPGRLVFSTTADGAASSTERMRIASNGTTYLGAAPGAEALRVSPVASSVNFFEVLGASTGGSPKFFATGSDASVQAEFYAKGTFGYAFFTNGLFPTRAQQLAILHTASSVNFLTVAGGAAGNAVSLGVLGSDAAIDIGINPKGAGLLKFGTYTAGILAQTGYITVKDAAGNTRNLLVG